MPEQSESLNRRTIAAFTVVGAAVTILGVVAAEVTDLAPVWSELCLHLGTGAFIGAVVFLAERAFVRKTTVRVEKIEADVAGLRDEILQGVEERIRAAVAGVADADESLLAQLRADPSYSTLATLLDRASGLGALHWAGLRVIVRGTDLCVRFHHSTDQVAIWARDLDRSEEVIDLGVERLDRIHVDDVRWEPSDDLSEVFARLAAAALQKAGKSSGPENLTSTVSDVADALGTILRSRTSSDPALHPIGPVLQCLGDGWAATSKGLENFEYPQVGFSVPELQSCDPLVTDVQVGYAPFTGGYAARIDQAREIWKKHKSMIANSKGWDPYTGDKY